MTNDIATVRQALHSAKSNAFLHRRGGLHKLWDQLEEGLDALDRIEKHLLPHQPSLMSYTNTSPMSYTNTSPMSYTNKRPEPDTMPPSSRPNHNSDTADLSAKA